MDLKQTLSKLSEAAGPSGFEHKLGDLAAELLRPLVDEVSTDALGNTFGIRKSQTPNAKKLLLSAHLDEIGFMVTKIEEGFLRFRTLGGIDPRVLPAKEVTVLTNPPLHGVIGALPPHLQTTDEMKKPYAFETLSIDVGLSQERAEALIPFGTPIVYHEKFVELSATQVSGKAMDDRACFVILLRMLDILKDKPLPVELVVVGSAQEEVGGRGSIPAAYAHNPDYAIAVDVTHAFTPDGSKDKSFKMEGGVPLSLGPNTNRKLSKQLIALAKQHELPWAPDVMEGSTGTDAWTMQPVRKGIATAVVSLPLKYMHTPTEVISIKDIEDTAKLLAELALSFEGGEL